MNTFNCTDITDSFKGFQRSNWHIKPSVTPSRAGPLAITWLTAISECVWIKFLYHEDGSSMFLETSEQTQCTPRCQDLSDHHCSYTSLEHPNTHISAPAENKSWFPGLPGQPSKDFLPIIQAAVMFRDKRHCWSTRCLVNVCGSTGLWEAVLQCMCAAAQGIGRQCCS